MEEMAGNAHPTEQEWSIQKTMIIIPYDGKE
jgi:hypothetical protein